MNSDAWLVLGFCAAAIFVNVAILRWAFKGKPDGTQ